MGTTQQDALPSSPSETTRALAISRPLTMALPKVPAIGAFNPKNKER